MSELEIIKSEVGAVANREPSPAEMFGAVLELIKRGDLTPEGVQAANGALALCERMEKRKAEKEFTAAFVAMKLVLPRIETSRAVPNNDGTPRYKYAPLEDIADQVEPFLSRFGFTATFGEAKAEPGRITEVCSLKHTGGHFTETPFTVRVGQGPPKASESQSDGAAHSFAQRRAYCNALGIIIRNEDNDARVEGSPIFAEQAESLRARVAATGTVEASFLKFAKATIFSEIMSSRYDELDQFLAKRERIQKAQRITADQAHLLRHQVVASGADQAEFLGTIGVTSFEDIPASKLAAVQSAIKKLDGK